MKVRFYCDVPPHYHPQSSCPTFLVASTMNPSHKRPDGWKRLAFDVDMPPDLIAPLFDVQAPVCTAKVIEEDSP